MKIRRKVKVTITQRQVAAEVYSPVPCPACGREMDARDNTSEQAQRDPGDFMERLHRILRHFGG